MRGNAVVTEHTTPQNQTAQEDERAWYAIHTYSGYENKVKSHLEARIASMDMRNKIFRVIVPMEEEVEIKQSQRLKSASLKARACVSSMDRSRSSSARSATSIWIGTRSLYLFPFSVEKRR